MSSCSSNSEVRELVEELRLGALRKAVVEREVAEEHFHKPPSSSRCLEPCVGADGDASTNGSGGEACATTCGW
jgi:hypothetical protein